MRRAFLGAGLAMLVVLGACSGAEGGAPAPTEPPATDRYGAPIPARSLDATALAARPCNVITERQLRALGLEPNGRLDPLPIGAACVWEDSGFTQQISITLYPNRDYLVDTYRARGMYQVFEPLTIGGLPAVAQKTFPQALTCTVTTGIAVGQAVDVTASEVGVAPGAPLTSCDKATRTAGMVVSNLPEQPRK